MEKRFVYVTCKDKAEALAVGRAVVGARLAACANILEPMQSIYWWQGKLVEDQEVVLIMKTTLRNVEALISKVKETHSYTVPCVITLPILEGNPEYLRWLENETES